MKKLYSAILIANLLIEGVGAFVLFAVPEFLVDVGNASAVLWAWNYGFVALAVGSAVFWVSATESPCCHQPSYLIRSGNRASKSSRQVALGMSVKTRVRY